MKTSSDTDPESLKDESDFENYEQSPIKLRESPDQKKQKLASKTML